MSKKPKEPTPEVKQTEDEIIKEITELSEKTEDEIVAQELIEFARSSGVFVPPGIKTIFISTDKQIFLNQNNAWTHCNDHGLKYYNVSWD